MYNKKIKNKLAYLMIDFLYEVVVFIKHMSQNFFFSQNYDVVRV